MRRKLSRSFARSCSASTSVIRPNWSRSPIEVTVTPEAASALGRPRPMLTAVSGFSEFGSNSRVTCASQPSVAISFGSQVCQMSIARKWERSEFSQPTPCTTATLPASYSSLNAFAAGCHAS